MAKKKKLKIGFQKKVDTSGASKKGKKTAGKAEKKKGKRNG